MTHPSVGPPLELDDDEDEDDEELELDEEELELDEEELEDEELDEDEDDEVEDADEVEEELADEDDDELLGSPDDDAIPLEVCPDEDDELDSIGSPIPPLPPLPSSKEGSVVLPSAQAKITMGAMMSAAARNRRYGMFSSYEISLDCDQEKLSKGSFSTADLFALASCPPLALHSSRACSRHHSRIASGASW